MGPAALPESGAPRLRPLTARPMFRLQGGRPGGHWPGAFCQGSREQHQQHQASSASCPRPLPFPPLVRFARASCSSRHSRNCFSVWPSSRMTPACHFVKACV
eukprot:7426265-Lingulodinium_polyedra.AAC.1